MSSRKIRNRAGGIQDLFQGIHAVLTLNVLDCGTGVVSMEERTSNVKVVGSTQSRIIGFS